MGTLAALAGRAEIKLSPKHPLLSRSFASFLAFVLVVLVPASVYLYLFHGDWFLLYTIDVREIPSAIALVGFVVEALVGVLGFALGATLLRGQHESGALGIALGTLLVGLAIPVVFRARLEQVGSYAQWTGRFGLVDFTAAPLFASTLVMAGALVLGAAFLLVRLRIGERR